MTYLGLVELGGGGGTTLRSEDDAADTDDELDDDDEDDDEEEPELDSFFRGRRISCKFHHDQGSCSILQDGPCVRRSLFVNIKLNCHSSNFLH